jgi:hypothetical protein
MKKIIICAIAFLVGCQTVDLVPMTAQQQRSKLKYISDMATKCWAKHPVLKDYRFVQGPVLPKEFENNFEAVTKIELKPSRRHANKKISGDRRNNYIVVDGKDHVLDKDATGDYYEASMLFLKGYQKRFFLVGSFAKQDERGRRAHRDLLYWSQDGKGCNE